MIPKVFYTAHLAPGDPPAHLAEWEEAWKRLHPDWEHVRFTLDERPVVLNWDEWQSTFKLPEPAGAASRLNILRYEVLARFGGVFVEPGLWPLRPLDRRLETIGCRPEAQDGQASAEAVPYSLQASACSLLENVSGFCTSLGGGGQPHRLSTSILGAERNHPAMWHAVRDLPHSVYTYRGVWDQTGAGFLSRVIDGHGHFRHWVVFHWSLFNLPRDQAEAAHAFGYAADPAAVEVPA